MAKVSRSIGLRGSEKKDQAVETQAAAPGAIRQIDPNATGQQPAPTTTASTGSLMNGAAADPAIVELRQPLLRVPLNALSQYRNKNARLAPGILFSSTGNTPQAYLPWQCLYFLPEPQGQTSLRPTLPQVEGSLALRASAAMRGAPASSVTSAIAI